MRCLGGATHHAAMHRVLPGLVKDTENARKAKPWNLMGVRTSPCSDDVIRFEQDLHDCMRQEVAKSLRVGLARQGSHARPCVASPYD